ncbi:MAG: MBL fold metallo-hydrolase [Bacteroidales bacterium]|nr:MBL fold metallo-hydrolase [Bacteroidales bacterium]
MKLTFLGTGTSQGVPVIACHCEVCRSADERDRRLRTSAMLEVEAGGSTKRLLFDIGPDFRQQMLRHEVERLDAILITHAHRDHVAGIDDIRALNYVQHGELAVYLNAEAQRALVRDYAYIFSPHQYPGLPEAHLHTVQGEFEVEGIRIMPIRVMHKDLPVLGYRVGEMAYITDANRIEEEELGKLAGLKVLVINALRQEHHWSHFNLEEALGIIEQVKPQRAYLTHISHEMGCYAQVEPTLPSNVHLAYDNLEVKI